MFLGADAPSVRAGGSTTPRWTSTDATGVVSSNFGATKVNGSKTVTPSATTPYTTTVSGLGGHATDTAKVTVGSGGGAETGLDVGRMVWVAPGELMMSADDLWDSCRPIHRVRITKGFWLGKYEVTNAQYAAFPNAHGSNQDASGQRLIYGNGYDSWCKVAYTGGTWVALAGRENHPVINVTWYGAKAYCDHYWLRLPTEAEWEYAARGSEGRNYP